MRQPRQTPGGPERTARSIHMGSWEKCECPGGGCVQESPPPRRQLSEAGSPQESGRGVEGPLVLPHQWPTTVNLSQGLHLSTGGQRHVRPRRRTDWMMDEGGEDNGMTLCSRAQEHSAPRRVERDAVRRRLVGLAPSPTLTSLLGCEASASSCHRGSYRVLS